MADGWTLRIAGGDSHGIIVTIGPGLCSLAHTSPLSDQIQAFLMNSDFNCMAPKPSILQSMSWSPSIRRMFLTLVPTLTTADEPLIFRSLMTVTESPSCSRLPWASFQTLTGAAASSAALALHSWPHSGQTNCSPSARNSLRH